MGESRKLAVSWRDGACSIRGFDSFDLHTTCQCGQAFRWVRAGNAGQLEEGVVQGRFLRLEQRDAELVVHPPADDETIAVVVDYFRLRQSHTAVEASIAGIDPTMAAAVDSARGLRLVAQEPWECLISYIVSANNSVAQISRVVENLSRAWGKPIGSSSRYSFPAPGDLECASQADVLTCKAGFRSRSICEAARRVARGELDLNAVTAMDYHAAKQELIRLRGVGEKVADCVLLFSMGKFEAFPVDVWIERVVRHLYFGGEKTSQRDIREWAEDKFGDLAGYAQEYLFAYARLAIPDRLRSG
ncbi:MAG TPA: 8-oxoguanine DNA glycosylase [Firmicutes bacterium]|nr:8-oxoguanine DNA glycosylase [Bacillota bacterium]